MRSTLVALLLVAPARGDEPFKDVNPNVLPPESNPSKMLAADAKRRMQEASGRESKAFAAVATRQQWEEFRDTRIRALRESLGTLPARNPTVRVTRTTDGDGFRVLNLLYDSRPSVWVTANLYLPSEPREKMPGFLLSHSHHSPKTEGELQDMGMTWARAGCAVLVPDHLGHGERRTHRFVTAQDYDKPFRPGRQDYFFRYNTNLQLSLVGESLMGWMVHDLMCGVDVLLKHPGIDRDRIILLGAVAGGGDPAGVTAALDPRIACVVPFNFAGWQPESSVTADPDREFAWFGDGYWESTRGLRNGARDGFAHWVIVGSVAPRKVIYAHEFAWDAATDPAWPRLRKVFDLYGAADNLKVVHGAGSVRGSGPGHTHCNNIGAVHRKGIHAALKAWFGIPIPEECSKRLPASELTCWTDAARKELNPKPLHDTIAGIAGSKLGVLRARPGDFLELVRRDWRSVLGDTEPPPLPPAFEGKTQDVAGGMVQPFSLRIEPGIEVPLLLFTPTGVKGKVPVVVMVAHQGKAAYLKQRGSVIAAFLKGGAAVCLVDVRGTGETKIGDSAGRTSLRTSISQTNLILGTPVLAAQLRDLRTVIRWLQKRDDIDGKKLAAWGEGFAPPNPDDANFAVPLDAPNLPAVGEPGAALLASLAALFEPDVRMVYYGGGVLRFWSFVQSPYLYTPHEFVVPGVLLAARAPFLPHGWTGAGHSGRDAVDARNRLATPPSADPPEKEVPHFLRYLKE